MDNNSLDFKPGFKRFHGMGLAALKSHTALRNFLDLQIGSGGQGIYSLGI